MNFKKFIPFCLTVLALGLASCGDDTTSSTGEQAHQHTYATEWSKDSTHHWHPCTGTDCGVYKDRAAHHGGEATCTAAAVCEDCGESYGSLKAHTFDQEVADAKYLKAEATHAVKATYFKSCTCGEKGTETFEHGTTVEHTKAESWSKDATNHWKGCTATGCENIKLDSAAHVYDQEVVHADYLKDAATCLADAVYFKSCICGAKGEATFTAANSKLAHDYDLTTYGLKTAEGHAHVCKTEGCNAHDTVVAHSTTEGTCEACGYVSHTHSWQETLTAGTDTHWIKCNSCDEKKPESEVAHTYENQGTTVTQNANCTLPQLTKKTCDCGAEHASETWESAPANGHDATGEWIEDATAGNHYKECAHCDGKAETAAHAYTEEAVDAKYLKSAATCTTAATYYKSCVCGAKGTEATFTSGQPSHTSPYYITVEVSGATKYFEVYKNSGGKYRFRFADSPATYWTYDAAHNTFLMELDGTQYFIGTYNTFETFSPSASKYFAEGNFVSHLYSNGQVVSNFTAGTEYQLGLVQGKVQNKLLYLAGSVNVDGFAESTTNLEEAVSVKLVGAYMSNATHHYYGCLNCDYVQEGSSVAHSGGTATCIAKANCEVCGAAYGNTLEHTFSQELVNLENGSHAHKCTTSGCTATDTPVKHTFVSGTCTCGATQGAETYNHTFANNQIKQNAGTINLSNISWTQTASCYIGFDNNNGRGVQIGKSAQAQPTFALTADFTNLSITKIVVNSSMAKDGNAKLTVSVGETVGLSNQSLTTTATDYTATFDNASGLVTISFTCTTKAYYIKSITIYYTEK